MAARCGGRARAASGRASLSRRNRAAASAAAAAAALRRSHVCALTPPLNLLLQIGVVSALEREKKDLETKVGVAMHHSTRIRP